MLQIARKSRKKTKYIRILNVKRIDNYQSFFFVWRSDTQLNLIRSLFIILRINISYESKVHRTR